MKASRLLIALTLVLPLAGGCKKKGSEQTTDNGSGSAMMGSGSAAGSAATGSGSDMAGSGSAGSGSDMAAGSGSGSDAGSGDTLMSHKGGNCPNLVATSTTKVTTDAKKGTVTMAISAADKNAIKTIQERTKAWKDRKPDGASGTHDSKGGKGGESGICAAAAPGLEVASSKDTKDGVTLTMKLDAESAKKDDAGKKAVLDEVQARADKGAAWMKDNLKAEPGGQGGTGDGGGDHGRDHSGKGDAKGKEGSGGGGSGGGGGTGGGGQNGTGGGSGGGKGSGTK